MYWIDVVIVNTMTGETRIDAFTCEADNEIEAVNELLRYEFHKDERVFKIIDVKQLPPGVMG